MPVTGQIRVGIIGAGLIGQTHSMMLRHIASRTEQSVHVVSIADVSHSAAEQLAARWPGASAFESAEEIIADPSIDAVWICTPTAMHRETCIAAVRAGKHIFCEKPLAMSASDADIASGFSQKMCLPARTAAMQVSRCIAVGVQIQTASIEGSAIISSADSNALAPGHRAASCSAAECDTSAIDTTWTLCSVRLAMWRSIIEWVWPIRPAPIIPTRICPVIGVGVGIRCYWIFLRGEFFRARVRACIFSGPR